MNVQNNTGSTERKQMLNQTSSCIHVNARIFPAELEGAMRAGQWSTKYMLQMKTGLSEGEKT